MAGKAARYKYGTDKEEIISYEVQACSREGRLGRE